ncbi:hypothetical protein WMF27_30790 [Sorangium sp. So ce281]|uniref:hypothetical protein n=1 Tax=unclassified Sorangium TaxID=2621164 RepID=UPI003F62AA99
MSAPRRRVASGCRRGALRRPLRARADGFNLQPGGLGGNGGTGGVGVGGTNPSCAGGQGGKGGPGAGQDGLAADTQELP